MRAARATDVPRTAAGSLRFEGGEVGESLIDGAAPAVAPRPMRRRATSIAGACPTAIPAEETSGNGATSAGIALEGTDDRHRARAALRPGRQEREPNMLHHRHRALGPSLAGSGLRRRAVAAIARV